MIGWLARLLLFRVLPRKIIPIITVVEVLRLFWSMRQRRYAVNDPLQSRTGPPPRWPGRPQLPRRRR